MPPRERESTSLFMPTDGQFWKFHGLKGMRLSIQTDKTVLMGEPSQCKKQHCKEPRATGHPSWVPFSGSSGPKHLEVQSQGDSLTGSLAQRGCLICEPLEGVEVGLWHLSGQAGGEQSQPSSSDCSRTVCFWGEVEEGQKPSAHPSAKMGSLGFSWLWE